MSHRLVALLMLSLLCVDLAHAADAKAAKDWFAKMITAAQAKNWPEAMNDLKQAYTADPAIMMQSDNGAMDSMVAGLKADASAKPTDVQTGKNLGWLLAVRGDYKGGLEAYQKIAGAAGEGDAEVKEQIRILTSYAASSGGGGGGTTTASATGSGGAASGGGASGGGASGGGGGDTSAGGTTTPTAGEAASGGGGAGGAGANTGQENGDVKALKEQLQKKDEEMEEVKKQLEEKDNKIKEMEAEITKLKVYQTQINSRGGLGHY